MRIAINAQLVSDRPSFHNTGVSRYIRQLVRGLAETDPENDYVVFVSRGVDGFVEGPRIRFESGQVDPRRPRARIWWEQVALPPLLRRHRIELLHAPMNVAPLRTTVPTVVTVHDLSFIRCPSVRPWKQNLYMKWGTRVSVRRTAHVITLTRAVASEVVARYGVGPERVTAIPLAPVVEGQPRDAEAGDRYFLCVGTREPRKNLRVVLEALSRVRHRIPHRLVIAGPEGWGDGSLEALARELGIAARTRFTGYLGDPEIAELYAGAEALVYPSFYEGFGLPLLEAMRLGCPVITSTAESLAEVAGGAALLVNPDDTQGLAAALLQVATDPDARIAMVRRGRRRAAPFSWRRTARATLGIYQQVHERARPGGQAIMDR